MQNRSRNNYKLVHESNQEDFTAALLANTYKSSSLTSTITNKSFIGQVTESGFKLISSTIGVGPACKCEGTRADENRIDLTTQLHPAFFWLYYVWLVVIPCIPLGFFIFSDTKISELDPSVFFAIIPFTIMALLFRLFIHGAYIISRNLLLGRMKKLLKCTVEKVP